MIDGVLDRLAKAPVGVVVERDLSDRASMKSRRAGYSWRAGLARLADEHPHRVVDLPQVLRVGRVEARTGHGQARPLTDLDHIVQRAVDLRRSVVAVIARELPPS